MVADFFATLLLSARPDELELGFGVVCSCDLDTKIGECFLASSAPFLETRSVGARISTDQDVGDVTEFVSDSVEQAVLVVNEFVGQLDGGVGHAMKNATITLGQASRGCQSLVPRDLHSASQSSHLGNSTSCKFLVELVDELFRFVDLFDAQSMLRDMHRGRLELSLCRGDP